MTRYIIFCRPIVTGLKPQWLYYGDADTRQDAERDCETIARRSGGTPRETIIKQVELPE